MEPVELELTAVESRPEGDGPGERLLFQTSVGSFEARLMAAEAADAAVLWVFGAGGGLGGPAGGVYQRLGRRFREAGVTSLELDYRKAGSLRDCVIDVVFAAAFLEQTGVERLVLVGHSFGGAVVINAAAGLDEVVGVAALSSQTFGTDVLEELGPVPTLFLHGEDDEVLPAVCSQDLYARADEPRSLILYPGCRHGLDECRERLDADLGRWIEEVLEL